MQNRQSKLEFVALLGFLIVATLVLTNGFVARISASGKDVDLYAKVQPIADVLGTILDEYVREPDIDKVVEGALVGMLNSLDRHSSYISADALQQMREDTKGEFEGIGVSIRFDDDKNVLVFQPLGGSPAEKAGILAGDYIIKIDGVSTQGMSLEDVAKRIRGPHDSVVKVTTSRRHEGTPEHDIHEFTVKRGNIPLESIKESRLLIDGIGYIRISDFKDNTEKDLAKHIGTLLEKGMTSLVLDLRWNPGGLLSASKQVCEVFLPKNTLVTYTQGRKTGRSTLSEDVRLYTEKNPMLPPTFPVVVLINDQTASSSEIVTGALQYWKRAIVVGEKTYGKGSVQTIIPLQRPASSALRLTTALYYTPAEVTIDSAGIKPDVEVVLTRKQQVALLKQMFDSVKDDAKLLNQQNHGGASGNEVKEETVEDLQLKRAVEVLKEDSVLENLIAKYHKDTHETQVAAPADQVLKQGPRQDKEEIEAAPEDDKKNEDAPDKQDK